MATDKELDAAITARLAAVREIERERDQEIREARDAIAEKYRERLREANQRRFEAEQAKRDHIEAGASHPWEGKKVFRIKKKTSRWGSRVIGEERLEGVVQVCRQNTPIPGNLGYSAPRLGQPFIRKLKKDGTVGTAIYTREDIENWQLAE